MLGVSCGDTNVGFSNENVYVFMQIVILKILMYLLLLKFELKVSELFYFKPTKE